MNCSSTLDPSAASVAHDLNNFLSAVLGAADAIARHGTMDPATSNHLANIRASTHAAAALARRLYAGGGAAEPATAPLPVNAALGRVADLLRYALPDGVTLTLVLAEGSPAVAVTAMALQRIVMNLASNAANAMPGGGALTLRSAIVAQPLGQFVQIDVQDTGCGIPPDVLPRIFDAYFTTARGRGGNGIGLAGVDALVRQAGGSIAVDSREGAGTMISLCFPLVPSVQPAAPPVTAAASPGAALLLVDDEEATLHHLSRALHASGKQVLIATSAEAALHLLHDKRAPRLAAVVTDLQLPGAGGADLVRMLRQRLEQPGLPAVVISGYPPSRTRHALAGLDGVSILSKPCEAGDVIKALAALTQSAGHLCAAGH